MKIIVTGATGLVGSEVLRQAILDNDIKEITALVRRPIDISHPKIKTVIHSDFLDYSGLEELFKSYDAMVWALGISQTQVNKEQYHIVTYDYTLAAAKAIKKANPDMTFLFVSGGGADSTEKSRTLFAREKGKTENALLKLGLKKTYNVRPAGIKPIHKNPNTSFFNKLAIPLFPIFELFIPNLVIPSDSLAMAILRILKKDSDKVIIENKELKEISAS